MQISQKKLKQSQLRKQKVNKQNKSRKISSPSQCRYKKKKKKSLFRSGQTQKYSNRKGSKIRQRLTKRHKYRQRPQIRISKRLTVAPAKEVNRPRKLRLQRITRSQWTKYCPKNRLRISKMLIRKIHKSQ